MIKYGTLTRRSGYDPRNIKFAVVDVETTGLPTVGRTNRICEIAIVTINGSGEVLDEYSTLVNPQRRMGGTDHHGITGDMVRNAPTFSEICDDVYIRLSDAVIVAHNLPFDAQFLHQEFTRDGVDIGTRPGLCTLINSRIQFDRYGYRLDNVAQLVTGRWPDGGHSALGDARALASVLGALLTSAPERLSWRGLLPQPIPGFELRSDRVQPRVYGLRRGQDGWLASLIRQLPASTPPPEPDEKLYRDYLDLVEHSVSGRKLNGTATQRLATMATQAGLVSSTAKAAHIEVLQRIRERIQQNPTMSKTECRRILRIANDLGHDGALDDLLGDYLRQDAAPLKGWRGLFLGTSSELAGIEQLATDQGVAKASRVTNSVRIVVADDDVQDKRLHEARQLGIPIVSTSDAKEFLNNAISEVNHHQEHEQRMQRGALVAERIDRERSEVNRRSQMPDFWRPRELSVRQYVELYGHYGEWKRVKKMVIETFSAQAKPPKKPRAQKVTSDLKSSKIVKQPAKKPGLLQRLDRWINHKSAK